MTDHEGSAETRPAATLAATTGFGVRGEEVVNIHASMRNQHTLAGERYFDRGFAEREWNAVWAKSWLVVCHVQQIPEPGDFVVEEFGAQSILVVRQDDGGVKAFFNVCQHRGNKLVMPDSGSMPSFTCSYHSWKWSLDGTCIAAQDPEDFPGGTPCGRHRLKELNSEVFASFIWINMDENPSSLHDYLGELYPILEQYPFDAMTMVQAITVRMPCNWKILQDNFRETYHIPTVHPIGLYVNEPDYRQARIENLSNGHSLLCTPGSQPSRYLPGGQLKIDEYLIKDLETWELSPKDYENQPLAVRKALQEQKRKLGPARGHGHYSRMSDQQLTDTFLYSLFPNTTFTCFADGMLFLRARPHPRDPEQAEFDCFFFASGAEDFFTRQLTASGGVSGGARDGVERQYINFGEGSVGVILDDDAGIMEAQQRGMHSRGWKGAELAGQEKRIAHYHCRIDELIAENQAENAGAAAVTR